MKSLLSSLPGPQKTGGVKAGVAPDDSETRVLLHRCALCKAVAFVESILFIFIIRVCLTPHERPNKEGSLVTFLTFLLKDAARLCLRFYEAYFLIEMFCCATRILNGSITTL